MAPAQIFTLNVTEYAVRKIPAVLILIISVSTWANDDKPKYQRGDCITPVMKSYSWYGAYAIVEAYSVIEGIAKEKSYILAFPYRGSNSSVFSNKIESSTQKVNPSLCGKQ